MSADARERGRDLLRAARRVLIFTGAGVSAESGVPTFRDAAGLWGQHRPEDLATPAAFARNPQLVWEWYRMRRERAAGCVPNAAHVAIAAWMRRRSGVTLVTQNVDDLHERAGAPAVLRLHGSLFADRCHECGHRVAPVPAAADVPECRVCGGPMRPDVVWFGEQLPEEPLEAAFDAARGCEACLVVGTSGVVYPAAGIVHAAAEAGAGILVVDPGVTEFDRLADLRLRGAAGDVVPALLA